MKSLSLFALHPAIFITASIVLNAISCSFLFFLLVLVMSVTGYISGFNAAGAYVELTGSIIAVGAGTAMIALMIAFLLSISYVIFQKGNIAKRMAIPAHVVIVSFILTLAVNVVLTILFLMFLIGMRST